MSSGTIIDRVESSSKSCSFKGSSGGVVETSSEVGNDGEGEGTLIDAIQLSNDGSPPNGGELLTSSPCILSIGELNSDASEADASEISPSSPGASHESSLIKSAFLSS